MVIDRYLRPCNPVLHPAYTGLGDPLDTRLPAEEAEAVRALMRRRSVVPDDEIDAIDAEIVGRSYWYVIHPDEIARAIVGTRRHISVREATVVLAACGEAGYDITGNGAPGHDGEYLPTRGPERDRLIWEAAEYWAQVATRHITYVSLGDARGFVPRSVQYDQPGSMHPAQQAALTLGPERDRYVERHTRLLLVVR